MAVPVWAIIPLKEPDLAKSRLSAALDPEARRRLFFLMATQVIRAAREADHVAHVLVVTGSEAVARLAQTEGARIVADESQSGFAEACRAGLGAAALAGGRRALILPGDLPLASSEEISKLTRAAPPGRAVGLVPDSRQDGTNALLLEPLDVIPLSFGPGSYALHEAAARAAGAPVTVLISEPLGLDIDSPADLATLKQRTEMTPALRRLLKETDPPPSNG